MTTNENGIPIAFENNVLKVGTGDKQLWKATVTFYGQGLQLLGDVPAEFYCHHEVAYKALTLSAQKENIRTSGYEFQAC